MANHAAFSVLAIQNISVCPATFIRRSRRPAVSSLPCLGPMLVDTLMSHSMWKAGGRKFNRAVHWCMVTIFITWGLCIFAWPFHAETFLSEPGYTQPESFQHNDELSESLLSTNTRTSSSIGPFRALLVFWRYGGLRFLQFIRPPYCFSTCICVSIRNENCLSCFH